MVFGQGILNKIEIWEGKGAKAEEGGGRQGKAGQGKHGRRADTKNSQTHKD